MAVCVTPPGVLRMRMKWSFSHQIRVPQKVDKVCGWAIVLWEFIILHMMRTMLSLSARTQRRTKMDRDTL